MRVALVVMPLASAVRPSLAAGLLKAGLARRGIPCDVKYFNLTLWKMLGDETYSFLADQISPIVLAGEWVFSRFLFESQGHSTSWESYCAEVLDDPVSGVPRKKRGHINALADAAPAFLNLTLASCDWSTYQVVGFTSMADQTMASLWLARSIKHRYPETKIVLGGPNFFGGVGREYIEAFDFVDYVATGEADNAFPALCEALRDGHGAVPAGILHRDRGRVSGLPAPLLTNADLDALPIPDYDDYLRVLLTSAPKTPEPWLEIEGSRGCWWSKCTFCGANGERSAYRMKSAGRIAAEADALRERYGPRPLFFTDNIMAMAHLRELLPRWAARPVPPTSFFEVKANLRREDLHLLRAAGVTMCQPGIESFSDRTLVLMRKGTTAAQNVAFLRWAKELGVSVSWNFIYGFPGEDLADFPRMLELMKALVHLAPPTSVGPIRLDRFSPHLERAADFGFENVTPAAAYRHVFPLGEARLGRLAMYFNFGHPGFAASLRAAAWITEFWRIWTALGKERRTGELAVRGNEDGGMVLVDSRFGHPPRTSKLGEAELALLMATDAPVREDAVLERACRLRPVERRDGREALQRLREQAVIVMAGSCLISVALLGDDARSRLRAARSQET